MINRSFVYAHVRHDTNEVFYIGIGSYPKKVKNNCSDKVRFCRAYSTIRSNFWRYVKNKTTYSVYILHKDLLFEEAEEIEIALIAFHGRKRYNEGTLVNFNSGGHRVIYEKPLPESQRQNISNALKGRISPTKNKVMSEKTKEKIRQAVYIQHKTNPPYGFQKPIYSVNNNNEIENWESIKHASKYLNIHKANIYYCIKHPQNSSIKGRKWFKSKEEATQYISTPKISKRIYALDSNKNVVYVFESYKEIANLISKSISTISIIVNKNKFYDGYFWIREKDYIKQFH